MEFNATLILEVLQDIVKLHCAFWTFSPKSATESFIGSKKNTVELHWACGEKNGGGIITISRAYFKQAKPCNVHVWQIFYLHKYPTFMVSTALVKFKNFYHLIEY